MAKLLRNWLAPELIGELREAIEWHHRQLNGKDRRDAGAPESDDESLKYTRTSESLRVEISRPVSVNSYVQIAVVNPSHHAVISDGQHAIVALFEEGLVRKLERETSRKFEQLKGCLLILKTFTLIIHGDRPYDRKMVLELESAKYRQGTLNSPVIGHPDPVSEHKDAISLYQSLRWRSNHSLGVPGKESQLDGQPHMTENMPGSLLSQFDGSDLLLSQAGIPHFDPRAGPTVTKATVIDDAASRAKRLLQMGGLRQTSPPAAVTLDETPTYNDRPRGLEKDIPTNNLTDNIATNTISAYEKPVTTDAKSTAHESPVTTTISKSTAPSSPISREEIRPANHDTSQLQIPGKPDTLLIKYSARGIPKDQRSLLNKEESWLPSIPGKKFPVTNVPLSVLNLLTEFRAEAKSKAAASKPETPKKPVAEIKATRIAGNATLEAEDHPEASQLSWDSSPIRPSPVRAPAPGPPPQAISLERAPPRGHTPPDSSALSPGWARVQLQRKTSVASMASSEASSFASELSQEAGNDAMETDSDQDLAVAVPHRLDAKRKPSAVVDAQVDVKESPCKKPRLDDAQRSSGAVPATQLGSSQPKIDSSQSEGGPSQSEAGPSQSKAGPSQSNAGPSQATSGPSQTRASPSQSSASQIQSIAVSKPGEPGPSGIEPHEGTSHKRRVLLDFGEDEVASQDPAAKHALDRREKLRDMRQKDNGISDVQPTESPRAPTMSARSASSQVVGLPSAQKLRANHDQVSLPHGEGVHSTLPANTHHQQPVNAKGGDGSEGYRLLMETEWPRTVYGQFGQSYCELNAVQRRLRKVPARQHIDVLGWRLGMREEE